MNLFVSRHRILAPRASLILLLGLGLLFAACSPEKKPRIRTVSQSEIVESLGKDNGLFLLDVRPPAEFKRGHIPGAVLIPVAEILARLDELRENAGEREIVIYCETGGRAMRTASTLLDQGFDKVAHLDGDMATWRREDLPSEN